MVLQGGTFIFSFVVASIYLVELTYASYRDDHHHSRPPFPATTKSSLLPSNSKHNYIVYVSPKPENPDHDSYIQFLTPIFQSENEAIDALVYSFTNISAFVAKLTPHQASRLQNEPHVAYIIRESKEKLHFGGGRGRGSDGDNITLWSKAN